MAKLTVINTNPMRTCIIHVPKTFYQVQIELIYRLPSKRDNFKLEILSVDRIHAEWTLCERYRMPPATTSNTNPLSFASNPFLHTYVFAFFGAAKANIENRKRKKMQKKKWLNVQNLLEFMCDVRAFGIRMDIDAIMVTSIRLAFFAVFFTPCEWWAPTSFGTAATKKKLKWNN